MGSVLAYEEAAEAFARDGVVCLRSVLDRDQVTAAAEAIDAVPALWSGPRRFKSPPIPPLRPPSGRQRPK